LGMVKVRTAGNSADKAKRHSSKPHSSKIRNNSNRRMAAGKRFPLLEALFDFYVYAKRSVLIAQPDNGDVSVHVVFHLNDLLLRRTHV